MRRILSRALVAAMAAPAAAFAVQACTGDDNVVTDAGLDASILDAAGDATEDVDVDAGPCAPYVVAIDAQAPDGGIECGIFQRFPCGVPSGLTLYQDCYFLLDDCQSVCPGSLYFNCHMYGDSCLDGSIQPDADPIVECATCPNGVGRRPRGLRNPGKNAAKSDSRVGAYFANAAHLEAASVHAFRILRRELEAHGAPADLREGAARAEADEIRHARATSKLARAYGAEAKHARVSPCALRSLEDIALENAVEGCVRETFGAAFAAWQAEHAQDPAIRSAMQKIARDEARHAALAWGVARWAESRLDQAARSRIATAKRRALRDLEAELDRQTHPELASRAGVPSMEAQRVLLRTLETELRLSA